MKKLLIPALILIGFAAFLFTRNTINEPSSPQATATPQLAPDSPYRPYETLDFEENSDKTRVLFFHASWCPTCRISRLDFINNLAQIPADVVLYQTDYDQEVELKKKYHITYQHTFVVLDSAGNELTKWNGGGIKELLANLP